MIKANELRLGNLVIYKPYGNKEGEIKTIAGLEGMLAYFNRHSNEYGQTHHLEPIPLTAEWLERMGFEECEKAEFADVTPRPGDGWWEIDILEYRLLIAPLNGHNLMCIYDENDTWILWRKFLGFEYVHQVQNLYFALAGSEIPLK